jgi:ABC-2 type transport system ATP-binding protein
VLILDRGRIVADDTPQRLVSLLRGEPQVIAEIAGPAEEVEAAVRALPGVAGVACERGDPWHRLVCRCARGADVRTEIAGLAAARGWRLRELRADARDLEDVFVEMTAEGDARPGGGPDAAGPRAGEETP